MLRDAYRVTTVAHAAALDAETDDISNAHQIVQTSEALAALKQAPDTAARLRALMALQQRIGFYEYRTQHHVPLFSRFGLNHDREALAALWTPYARESRALLAAPIQQDLEARLVDLGQMPTTQVDDQLTHVAQGGQGALKTYLMMADPQRADAGFLTQQLPKFWNTAASLTAGEKIDLSEHLLGFWADHLKSHPDWRIQPRQDLVAVARQTLLAVIGVKNSEDTVYQNVLASVGHKYPDQTLATLTAGTDTRGLFRTAAAVPGVYTRQAWEGSIENAIDDAAKHNGVAGDWVLGNVSQGNKTSSAQTPEALRTALRARYFADYAEHWQSFMNSLRCDSATTLPAAISQLKLIADARQSPLIALMKALDYQGGAGAQRDSLSDTLVNKAQNILGKKDDAPQAAKPDPAGPLGSTFGPVLRLVAQSNANVSASARTRETVLDLTPGGHAHREVMALLRFYLGYEAEAHLEMHVRPELMPDPVLKPKQTSLGLTTQLFDRSAPTDEPARTTRVHLGRWDGAAE